VEPLEDRCLPSVSPQAGLPRSADPATSARLSSTYASGGVADQGFAIGVGKAGSAYVTGQTGSAAFPTSHPMQSHLTTTRQNGTSAFASELMTPLVVGMSASAATVRVGQNVTFTVTVTNHGAVAATGVVLTDVLMGSFRPAASFRVVSLGVSQGTVIARTASTVLVNFGSLPARASAVLTVVVAPLTSGPLTSGEITNQASAVTSGPGQGRSNTASKTVRVLGAPHFSLWLPDLLLFPDGRDLLRR
jgi:uncharacterized repeat protein (TIGR01451 family)